MLYGRGLVAIYSKTSDSKVSWKFRGCNAESSYRIVLKFNWCLHSQDPCQTAERCVISKQQLMWLRDLWDFIIKLFISMTYHKTAVSPLLTHWLSHWGHEKSGRHFPDYIFNHNFLYENIWNFNSNITEICSQWSDNQYSSVGSDNGLAPIRRQAIIWANGGLAYRHTHMRHSAPSYCRLALSHWDNDTAPRLLYCFWGMSTSRMKLQWGSDTE